MMIMKKDKKIQKFCQQIYMRTAEVLLNIELEVKFKFLEAW